MGAVVVLIGWAFIAVIGFAEQALARARRRLRSSEDYRKAVGE